MSPFCSASWGEGSDYNLVPTAKTVRGSNPSGGEIFHTRADRPWGTANLLYNGYREFPGGKEVPVHDANLTSLLVPWSTKSTGLTPLSYGPYVLYRASVPVQK